MSFRLPTFNLTCSIWRVLGLGGLYAIPDVTAFCNLSPGKRVMLAEVTTPSSSSPDMVMELMMPALTDVRAAWNGLSADCVEVPTGSHRFYSVVHVDDTAKGFANEFRLVTMRYMVAGNLTFAIPAPVPLP
jgi:hypothetical protein